MAVGHALLYESKCCAFRKNHSRKMGEAEMRMLRCMTGHTLKGKIQSENTRKELGVANIEKKMKDNRLRYFCMCKDRELKKKKEYRKLEL